MFEKVKRKHIIIGAAAALLIVMVKMCEADDFTLKNQQGQVQLQEFEQLHEESDSLLHEILHEIDNKKQRYTSEIDSLNNIILNDNLTQEEVDALKKQVKKTKELLKKAQDKESLVIIDSGATVVETVQDSVVWNIIEKDSIKWNVIEKDSIVYNIIEKDSVVNKTVYEIDTVIYDSEDIKKLKLKND